MTKIDSVATLICVRRNQKKLDLVQNTNPVQILRSLRLPEVISDISCGQKHVLLQGRSGKVFSFGSNDEG
jgi:alpha-tubulin suppressor-like RCC1 family protein